MVDFFSRDDVKEWLDAIEPEPRRREIAIVIAARAALRVTPLLVTALTGLDSEREARLFNIVLPALRCVAFAWTLGQYPAHRDELGGAYSASVAPKPSGPAGFSAVAFRSAAAAEFAYQVADVPAAADVVARSADALRATGFMAGENAFSATVADAAWIQTGMSATDLAGAPLSLEGLPNQVSGAWAALKALLLASHNDWRVWTDWYDARLAGAPANEGLEVARALIADEIWKQGPRAVNAEIARLIKEHERPKGRIQNDPPKTAPPTIPSTKPAAIEPEIDDAARIVLPTHPATSSMAEASVIAALKSLSEFMAELADAAEIETNVDKRMVQRLRKISAAIPKHLPDNVEVFSLGHRYEELAAYKAAAEDSWPPPLAARFVAMTLAFDRTLRRFAEWRSFISEPRIEKLRAGEVASIANLGRTMSDGLREQEVEEIVDPRIAQGLDAISVELEDVVARAQKAVDPIELGFELRAQDVLESLNNILKRVAERCLILIGSIGKGAAFVGHKGGEYGRAFVVPADKSLKNALNAEGEKFGPWVIKLLKRSAIVAGGPVGLTWLIGHFPHMFSWLDGFMKFIEPLLK